MTHRASLSWFLAPARIAALLLLVPIAAKAGELATGGTLRAVYLANNPVQARIDPVSGEQIGPAADITRILARQGGDAPQLEGLPGVRAVIDAIKKGDADIGFLAYDPDRAAEVDFSRPYAIAHNTYLTLESPTRNLDQMDRSDITIGVGQGDAADLFLKRTLQSATLRPNPGGSLDQALAQLQSGEIDAYAGNRQRLTEFALRNPGLRVMRDNFLGVQQAIVVAKGSPGKVALLNRFIEEARRNDTIDLSIYRAGLVGVEQVPWP